MAWQSGTGLRNARIAADGNQVAVTDRAGRTCTFSRVSVLGIALRAIEWQGARYPTVPVIGYDHGHHCLFRFRGEYWQEADLAALKNLVSRRPSKHLESEEVGPKEVEQQFPGALGLWERRPWLVVGVVAAVILGIILFGPFARR